MIRAGEDRKKENKDFQQTVADQCIFQKLLQAPPQHPEGILQEEGGCTAPAGACWPSSPPGCKNYKKNVASGGVMGMIQRIMNDSKAMEAEALLFSHRSSTHLLPKPEFASPACCFAAPVAYVCVGVLDFGRCAVFNAE